MTIPRIVLGVTGGIGAGKSTVSAMFATLGATVVDCDDLGRKVVEPDGSAYSALVERFGNTVLSDTGHLDRAALGAVVFSDRGDLADLNAITHPAINHEIEVAIAQASTDIIALDMAVLVETSLGEGLYDKVVVVEAPMDQRLLRLLQRRGMSRADAEARIQSQATDAERRRVADYVIINDGDEEKLAFAAAACYRHLTVR